MASGQWSAALQTSLAAFCAETAAALGLPRAPAQAPHPFGSRKRVVPTMRHCSQNIQIRLVTNRKLVQPTLAHF